MNRFKRRPQPLWRVALTHIVLLGIALCVYALFHHVIPREEQAVGIVSVRETEAPIAETPTPEPTRQVETIAETASPEATATAEPEPTAATDRAGSFRIKFADKFTDGEVIQTDTSYASANVAIELKQFEYAGCNVNYADIYIADISYFVTAFANDTFGRNQTESVASFAKRFNALVTLNGDYYSAKDNGVVIRNGTLYRNAKNKHDVCVLYWTGVMSTFSPKYFNAETEMENGAYQAWCFGPKLLDNDGKAMSDFNSDVNKANPRSAIGYFEPGHYCFVMVEGRNETGNGMKMQDLSKLMEKVGCMRAYNLDGGQSAQMMIGNAHFGQASGSGRSVSDVLMILDGEV